MFHPSDLEGEVDHSFFDSDDGGGRASGEGEKRQRKGCKDEKKSLPAAQGQQGALSPRPNGAKERNQSRRAGRGNGQSEAEEEERSEASSISSGSCKSDKVINNVNSVDEGFSLHSKMPSGTLTALLAGPKEVDDEDGYHQSQNETEEEDELPSSQRQSSLKGRNMSSPRRVRRSRRHQRPSCSSSESDGTDSAGSRCGDHNSSAEPTKKPRRSSAGSQDLPPARAEDSEDTATDVTPLSSPDRSLLQSLDLNDRDDEDGNADERRQESAPSSGRSQTTRDSYRDEDEFSFSSESQLGGRLIPCSPGGRNRKNYSFNNAEVRRIDRENQRLLWAMSRHSSRSSSGSAIGLKSRTPNKSPVVRLAHSAINRQREQQRIDRDNMALLRRLESVKPTRGLKRTEQMADFHQQRYWGTPTHPTYKPLTMRERTPSKAHSAGKESRLNSPAHHSPTSEPTSMMAPGARPKKPGAARPAWN
ncbi:cilia- and flagella-associated protein 97 [Genypterus blacodes]|uniref:cilia- and flagella-associated protein 97 n=1 Tax=Genypterus blacodes TaxID=154954 RepID=UPI003F75A5DA